MFVAESTPECLKEHVKEAEKVDTNSISPCFEVLASSSASSYESTMDDPFTSLAAALEEIICHRGDIKLFLGENKSASTSLSEAPIDLSQMVLADVRILPRLCVLHVIVVWFQANFEKQFVPEISNFSCKNYAEFCFFFCILLGKVKKLSELPKIDVWS